MNHDFSVFLMILTVALVTLALRIAPFFVMDKLSSSQYLKYISEKMPVGIMVLLVVYTFIHIDFQVAPYGLPQLISAFCVLAIYWFTKNALASIGIGLLIHLAIANFDLLTIHLAT